MLPKAGSKLYAGNFKEKLQETFGQDTNAKLKGIEVKNNKDGRVVTDFFCNPWLVIKLNEKFNIKFVEGESY